MAKPNFTLPNKPAIKSGSILSYNYTDDFTFVPAPLTFNRDSAATRVNEKGLIEDVGYFGPELVQNGDFSEIGPELVTNGNFDDGLSGWSSHSGSTLELEDGKAKVTTVSAQGFIKRTDLSIQSGKTYFCKADITNATNPVFFINGTSNVLNPIPLISGNTYGGYITTTGNNSFFYIRGNNTDGEVSYIDNVSVKEVGQNWTVANDDANNYVEFNQDEGTVRLKFLNTSPLTTLSSDTQYLSGKKYKLTVDVKEVVSGAIKIDAAGVSELFNSVGIQERIIEPTGNSNVSFYRATADVDITLNSVSLIEILGDKPRIDYSDSLTEPSLLLEPQSTNLVGYSLPNDTNWSKGSNTTITENYAVSPDGTQNASRFVMPTGSGTYAYYQFTATSTTDHTLSFYAKNNGGDADVTMAFFVASQTQNITLTNEWQRFEFTTSITSGNAVQVGVDNITSVDMLIYGVQCEALPYATSYIPTSGSTATRLGETANNAGDVNVFNSEEGVLYVEMAKADVTATEGGVRISRDTSNEIRLNFATGNRLNVLVNDGGSNQVYMDNTSYNLADYNKIAIKYKLNDYAVYVDGTEIHTDTNATVPTGLDKFNFHQFYGKVRNVQVFNKALTDRELEILTIQ